MGLESATYISQLDSANPTATDPVSEGDDHLRLIKAVLKNQFSGLSGTTAVTTSGAELNQLDGFAMLQENNSIWLGNDPSGTTSTASNNVAVGLTALDAITTGDDNVAIGQGALSANTTGGSNVAVGSTALDSNTEGSRNVAMGFAAGDAITTGSDNTAIGNWTLKTATTVGAILLLVLML